MAFKKGQSGNPSGSNMNYRKLSEALKVQLAADPKKAHRIASKLLDMAEEGDIHAAKLVFERLEGKADQNLSIEHSGSVNHNHNITADERKERIKELLFGSNVIEAEVIETKEPTRRDVVARPPAPRKKRKPLTIGEDT